MIPKKKLQVFVSSTYTDLRDERQAAVEGILSAGHIPAGMELFAAGDQSQMGLSDDGSTSQTFSYSSSEAGMELSRLSPARAISSLSMSMQKRHKSPSSQW
jgi:Domain of unknown function (DUF4062)